MLQTLKKKTLTGKLAMILLLAAALIGCAAYFGADYVKLIQGPQYFVPLEDNDILSLTNQYLQADVDTLVDYYAETVRSETGKLDVTTSREYLMPINTADGTVYVGLEVPRDLMYDAEAVVEDTTRYLDDTDGSYEWDGSYVSVRGTLRAMDEETQGLYYDYLDDMDLADEFGTTFLPLVLVHGEIGNADGTTLLIVAVVMAACLIALLYILIRALTGGYQKQIRAYINASADPQGTEQDLDRFYEDTAQDGSIRMSSRWLMYDHGGDSWILAGNDVVWAYQYTLRRKMYGIITVGKECSVKVFSASEPKKSRCHAIPVRNDEAAQELLAQLQHNYPDVALGYSEKSEAAYNADPAAFHRTVADSRRQSMQSTAAPAETAAETTAPTEA